MCVEHRLLDDVLGALTLTGDRCGEHHEPGELTSVEVVELHRRMLHSVLPSEQRQRRGFHDLLQP